MKFHAKRFDFLFIIVFLAVFFAYLPGLAGVYLLDDIPSLSRLDRLDGTWGGVLSVVFDNTGRFHDRPISYLSFLLNSSAWPGSPFIFKLTNVFFHLLTGLVFVKLLSLLLSEEKHKKILLITIIGIWILHPLNVSTVLYAVQRMTILSTLFLVSSLYFYVKGRVSAPQHQIFHLAAAAIFAVFSILSKQNGILVIPLVAITEFYLRFALKLEKPEKFLGFGICASVFCFILIFTYIAFFSGLNYEHRDFSMAERFLVQAEVIWRYILMALIPKVSWMTLYHDSYSWFTDRSIVMQIVFWFMHAILIVVALLVRRQMPLIFYGISWFYISHLLESTIIPLEYMFEHRNYLPLMGISLTIGYILIVVLDSIDNQIITRTIIAGLLVLLLIQLVYRSAIWGDEFSLKSKWAYYQNDSPRAQYDFAVLLEKNVMPGHAFAKIVDSNKVFNKLGFVLYAWRLQCHGAGTNAEKVLFPSNEDILGYAHSSEVSHQLRLLLEEWKKGACIPDGYSNANVVDFLNSVLQLKHLSARPRYYAQLLDIIGDFYIGSGWAASAIDARLELFKAQPTVDTALKNVDLALKLGLVQYAEEYLDIANKLNSERSFFAKNRESDILFLSNQLGRIRGL